MRLTERRSRTTSPFRFRLPGETTLIGVVLALFVILHILTGAIVQHAAPAGIPMQEEPSASSYD